MTSSSVPVAAPTAPAGETRADRRLARRDRARRSSYRSRFMLIYLLLAAVLGGAATAFVLLSNGEAPEEAAAWSAWEPTGSQMARLRQIADRIPQSYQQNGEQLVVSTASMLTVPTEQGEIPIESVFVQPDTSRGLAEEEDIDVHDGTKIASYALCGLGTSDQCAITKGKPSVDRFTFLRRQAVELSLYTLKYVEGIDGVAVFMPPTQDGQSNGLIFLTRDNVKPELSSPIGEVLPTRLPKIGKLAEAEEGLVLRLTEPRTYAFQVQAAPNGSPILVLSPPEAAGS